MSFFLEPFRTEALTHELVISCMCRLMHKHAVVVVCNGRPAGQVGSAESSLAGSSDRFVTLFWMKKNKATHSHSARPFVFSDIGIIDTVTGVSRIPV